MAIWAAADFSTFWVSFHELFFTNDLWLLDPAKSVLINMVPAQFFYDLVMRIVGLVGVFLGVSLALSIGYLVAGRIRRRALMTIIEE